MEWSARDRQFLETNRGRLTCREMAERLNEGRPPHLHRTEGQVSGAIHRLMAQRRKQGRPLPRLCPANSDRVMSLHRDTIVGLWKKGWSDRDIAAELHISRHSVATIRRRLNLGSNSHSARQRQKYSKIARETYDFRVANYLAAEAMGWPGRTLAEAKMLTALAEHGPLTPEQICPLVGRKWKPSGAKGFYHRLKKLAGDGLIVCEWSFGRTSRGLPFRQSRYRLAEGVERVGDRVEDDDNEPRTFSFA